MDNPPLPEPPRRIQDDPHYQFRLYSTLTHAERASVHVRRARIVADLRATDEQASELIHRRRALLLDAMEVHQLLWPKLSWCRGRRPPRPDRPPLPPLPPDAELLSGGLLRQTCVALLHLHGAMSLYELHTALHLAGYGIAHWYPVKALADAMRLEVLQHRAERVCRAVYRAARGGGGEVDVDPELRLSPDRHWPGEPGGAGPTWRDGSDLSPRGGGLPEGDPDVARGEPAAGLVRAGVRAPGRGAGPSSTSQWPAKLYGGGWICASWPAEYGGKGLSTMENVVLAEEFAKAGAPLRADFFGDTLVGPTMLQWGSEEQKKEFLPKILSGEIRWCQGFSEPDSGSDLASLKTTAVLDGEEWVVNGQKVWTTQAQHADYVFLLARTDPDRLQAHGHLLPLGPHATAGHRGAADRPARRDGRVQRGVLRQRPLPEGQRRRRRQQRVAGGEHDARLRAG